MKFPKKAQDIENEILLSADTRGDLRLRQLISILSKVDDELIIEGIIRVFENPTRQDNAFKYQEVAGQILTELKPKTQKDIVVVLQRTLKNWDKSVEQFPFWLRDNYGLDKLIVGFGQISSSDIEKDKIETIKWWLQLKANA